MDKEIKKVTHISPIISVALLTMRLVIRLALPAFMYFAGLFKGDKDWARRLYISINNLVVKYELQKKSSVQMLVLLPHCMQSKDCSCRITEDINNCRRCGGCKIGEVEAIMERYGIRAVVAKGGTAARNIVKEFRPDLILAVACERELLSGMSDVGKIPVIGVINQRPNGYCTNTTLEMAQLKKVLQELMGNESGIRDKGLVIREESRVSGR